MNEDEELHHLRQANQDVREGLKQAISAIESMQERIKALEGLIEAQRERIKTLERQQAKDSHNSGCVRTENTGGINKIRPPTCMVLLVLRTPR